MNRIILLCAMLTVSFSVIAEPELWMKKDDPDSLGLWVEAQGCPFDKKELRNMAEGEYLRARIKPTGGITGLKITISALCQKVTMDGRNIGTNAAFTLDFSTRTEFPDLTIVRYGPGVLILLNLSQNKMEAKTKFLTMIRDQLNLALTDYLKANME